MSTHQSLPATLAQSGRVRLPATPKRARTYSQHGGHPITVGDTLCVMSWGRASYTKVTVTAVKGESVTIRDEWDGTERTANRLALTLSAAQAYAHFGRSPETPGVGLIVPADDASPVHHLTTAGRCLTCGH